MRKYFSILLHLILSFLLIIIHESRSECVCCVCAVLPPQASLFSCNLISPSTNPCVRCWLRFEAQIKFSLLFDQASLHFFLFLEEQHSLWRRAFWLLMILRVNFALHQGSSGRDPTFDRHRGGTLVVWKLTITSVENILLSVCSLDRALDQQVFCACVCGGEVIFRWLFSLIVL